MGFRYRKSIRLGSGVRLNLSKRGVGISFGVKGFRVSSGPTGGRVTVSIPGTGLSYAKHFSHVQPSIPCPPQQSALPPTDKDAFKVHVNAIYCVNCHTQMFANAESCPKCGRCILQEVPSFGYSRSQFRMLIALVTITIIAFSVTVIFALSHWTEHRRAEALQIEKQRQQHIAKSLYSLQQSYPHIAFAICNTDKTPIMFQSVLSRAEVRSVTLTRSNNTVTASVGIIGIQKENQAPTIYVTLYNKDGHLLSRAPIVKFVMSKLEYGQTREIEDEMELPEGADPVIVSVDDAP